MWAGEHRQGVKSARIRVIPYLGTRHTPGSTLLEHCVLMVSFLQVLATESGMGGSIPPRPFLANQLGVAADAVRRCSRAGSQLRPLISRQAAAAENSIPQHNDKSSQTARVSLRRHRTPRYS